MIPYSTQTISKSDIKGVSNVLRSDWLTQGPLVKKFEKELSKKINSKYSVAVNSGTSALHISCMALGLKKGDILWTVPNTFVASANCGLLLGANIDFVDIDKNTFNIDLNLLEKKLLKAKKINKLPKILVPVHFAGQPTAQDKIWKLSKKFKFFVLEDASHSLGSYFKNEPVGSCKWSHITVFSFHPVKIITTGEGGAAVTNNRKLFNKLRMYANHGITKERKYFKNKNSKPWHYEQQLLGLNYRMSDISASLGLSQLKNLNTFVKKRNDIAKLYNKYLNTEFIQTPFILKNCVSSFHLFVIKLVGKKKLFHEKLFNFLRKKNIYVHVHYTPIHLQPFYKQLGFKKGLFKKSEEHAETAISLPIYPKIKKQEVLKVIRLILNFEKKHDK